MKRDEEIRNELHALLQGGHAHAPPEEILKSVPSEVRGKVPRQLPYSPWQLLEHMRLAQWDILEFSRNPDHESPEWPKGYWPESPEPPSAKAWNQSLKNFLSELEEMSQMVTDSKADIYKEFAHGTGQNLLREALTIADHNAYHLGQMVVVLRLLDAWKE